MKDEWCPQFTGGAMYTIVRLLNGKFYCQGRLQDSTERWEEQTMPAAIASMKTFMKHGNGEKNPSVKMITFLEEQRQVVEQVNYVPMKRRR